MSIERGALTSRVGKSFEPTSVRGSDHWNRESDVLPKSWDLNRSLMARLEFMVCIKLSA